MCKSKAIVVLGKQEIFHEDPTKQAAWAQEEHPLPKVTSSVLSANHIPVCVYVCIYLYVYVQYIYIYTMYIHTYIIVVLLAGFGFLETGSCYWSRLV